MQTMIDIMINMVHAIPLEYHVSAIMFVVVLLFLRFSQYKAAQFFAFPVAMIIWAAIEIFQLLKCLQLSFLKKQVKEGHRYKVMLIFILTITTGIGLYLLSYVFLVLMTISPWYYLPSFVLSTISKYINLVLVPSVIRHGSDKLNTFGLFRWMYRKVSTFWARFTQFALYKKFSETIEKLRMSAQRYISLFRKRSSVTKSANKKRSLISKGVGQVNAIIDDLNARKR